MAPSTFENISIRKGYSKGQSPMLMKWSPNTMVMLEPSSGPYGQRTVKFIADDGFDFAFPFTFCGSWPRSSSKVKSCFLLLLPLREKIMEIQHTLLRLYIALAKKSYV